MANILFIYSTVDGHTLEICQRLSGIAEKAGLDATISELTADSSPELEAWDQVVVGASIRYGKHRPEVVRFINENVEQLQARHGAFFSVNAVARKPEKRDPDTNPYVKKFFKSVSWKPALIGIFGGRIHYARYGFMDRTMIRFIMWMTKGPTNKDADVDFTDWNEVEAFGRALCELQK